MKKFISLICVLSICLFLGFANKVEPVSAEGNPNLHKLILTNNDCYKAGQYITPKGIMVHSTGANNPNLRRYLAPNDGLIGTNTGGNHWNQSKPDGQQKCVHAFIGKLADGLLLIKHFHGI